MDDADPDPNSDSDADADADADASAGGPIGGQALLLAGAKASVPPGRLPRLLERAQAALAADRDAYRRRYELVHESEARWVFLVPKGHWEEVGDRIGFDRREADAVRRAHAEQLRRIGSHTDRREEFESALDVRETAVVGASASDGE